MMYAARQTSFFSGLQIVRPIGLPTLSKPVKLTSVQHPRTSLLWIQIALYAAMLASLSFHLSSNVVASAPTLYVSARVEEGAALIVMVRDMEVENAILAQTQNEQKRLVKNEVALLKAGDRIEVVHGIVLLTYADGSMHKLSHASFTIPVLNPTSKNTSFSIGEWFTRIIKGLNQPFSPSVTVASVLG